MIMPTKEENADGWDMAFNPSTMTPKEQTPDAQPENSAYVQEHLSSSKEHLSTSKPESGVSEAVKPWRERVLILAREFLKKQDICRPNIHPAQIEAWVKEAFYQGFEAFEREHAAKQAELVEQNQRLKSQLKDYCNDCQHPTVNEQQAAELSKLRQENEAKRSDLTDKLEEAVRHMDNGHTAQATTLIYEVIGELEPKGE